MYSCSSRSSISGKMSFAFFYFIQEFLSAMIFTDDAAAFNNPGANCFFQMIRMLCKFG